MQTYVCSYVHYIIKANDDYNIMSVDITNRLKLKANKNNIMSRISVILARNPSVCIMGWSWNENMPTDTASRPPPK